MVIDNVKKNYYWYYLINEYKRFFLYILNFVNREFKCLVNIEKILMKVVFLLIVIFL